MIDHEEYETRAEATAAIHDYIDRFYNTRVDVRLFGYVSPVNLR